jgi:hypothetical protein
VRILQSVTSAAVNDAIRRASFTEHLADIPHELNWLLVSCEVTTVGMLIGEHHIMSRVKKTVERPFR